MKNIENTIKAYADVFPGCANYWECIDDLTGDILDNIDEADIATMKLPAEALNSLDETFRLAIEARVELLLFYVHCVLAAESGKTPISYSTKNDRYRVKALHIAERFAKSADFVLAIIMYEDYGNTLEVGATTYTINATDSPTAIFQMLIENDFCDITYDGKTMTVKARYNSEKNLVFKF